MHLLIRAVSLAGQPLTQAISAYFDERGGTIGRSDTNTLALPDPERRISRLQAEVSRGAEGWRILNVGNANPIWHNNRPVPPGDAVLLDEGDELQVGTYALRVNYSQNDETARTITKGRATIDSRTVIASSGLEPRTDSGRMATEARAQGAGTGATPTLPSMPAPLTASAASASSAPAAAPTLAPASPFADLLGDLATGSASATPPGAGPKPSSASPFADILGFGAAPSAASAPVAAFAPASPPAHHAAHTAVAPAAQAFAAPAAAPAAPAAATRLPDDFDPFADLAPVRTPSGRAASPVGAWDLPSSPSAPSAKPASPFDAPGAAAGLPGDLDLLGAVQPPGAQSIDHLFGLGGKPASPAADPLADFLKKTEPAAPAQAPVGAPVSVDPLALLSSRENIVDAPRGPAAPTLPDDVPELNAAMPLPPVAGARSGVLPGGLSGATPGTVPAAALPDDCDIRTQAGGRAPSRDGEEEDTRPGELDALVDITAATGARLSPPPIETQVAPENQAAASHRLAPLGELGRPASSAPPPASATVQAAALADVPGAKAAADTGTAAASDTAALWAAFCEGAGVRFSPPQGLNPELMRVIGQLLRNAVDGSLKLVAARAATKTEMRAEVTVIQAKRNNPLKFSPDTQSAMEQLLQPPLRGFLSGPDAVSDAMDDLLGHTIGTMVGMRAALEGVLSRFEPSQLEAKLVGHSMLDSLLPMNRRAKLWELYLQHYEAVRSEAQDDFHNLFGRAFLQAYEEQLDRLEAERREAGRAPRST